MSTDQSDLKLPALDTLPNSTPAAAASDLEDGEIVGLQDQSLIPVKKKEKSKNKAKKPKSKPLDLDSNMELTSETSERSNSDDDSDGEMWLRKKYHYENIRKPGNSGEEPGETMEEDYSESSSYRRYLREKKHSKEKKHHSHKKSKDNKYKSSSPSPSSTDETHDKDKRHLYPCKFYIAYGKCDDPNCRCVHAPLSREDEIHRFVEENEEFFAQVFKKFPNVCLPPPLLKILTDKFRPPSGHLLPNNPSPNPFIRPMPPPKFFASQDHYPLAPNPNPPVIGYPPYFSHPSPYQYTNMYPPMGINVMPQIQQPIYPGQLITPIMPIMTPMQGYINPMVQMGTLPGNFIPGAIADPLQYDLYANEGAIGSGVPVDIRHQLYTGQVLGAMPLGYSPQNSSVLIQGSQEGSKNNNVQRSPEQTGSSKSSPSSTAKELGEELDKLTKGQLVTRKVDSENGNKIKIEKVKSPDIQSQETSSATPENRCSREEELKRASTTEKITKLVELFKAKQMNKPKPNEEVQKVNNQQSPIKPVQQEKPKVVVAPIIDDPIYNEEPKILDNREESEDERDNDFKDAKEDKKKEEFKEEVNKGEIGGGKQEQKEVTKKSIYEGGSVNELLLKQIKSALPTQSQSADNVKNLINMYLKLSKNPILQDSIQSL